MNHPLSLSLREFKFSEQTQLASWKVEWYGREIKFQKKFNLNFKTIDHSVSTLAQNHIKLYAELYLGIVLATKLSFEDELSSNSSSCRIDNKKKLLSFKAHDCSLKQLFNQAIQTHKITLQNLSDENNAKQKQQLVNEVTLFSNLEKTFAKTEEKRTASSSPQPTSSFPKTLKDTCKKILAWIKNWAKQGWIWINQKLNFKQKAKPLNAQKIAIKGDSLSFNATQEKLPPKEKMPLAVLENLEFKEEELNEIHKILPNLIIQLQKEHFPPFDKTTLKENIQLIFSCLLRLFFKNDDLQKLQLSTETFLIETFGKENQYKGIIQEIFCADFQPGARIVNEDQIFKKAKVFILEQVFEKHSTHLDEATKTQLNNLKTQFLKLIPSNRHWEECIQSIEKFYDQAIQAGVKECSYRITSLIEHFNFASTLDSLADLFLEQIKRETNEFSTVALAEMIHPQNAKTTTLDVLKQSIEEVLEAIFPLDIFEKIVESAFPGDLTSLIKHFNHFFTAQCNSPFPNFLITNVYAILTKTFPSQTVLPEDETLQTFVKEVIKEHLKQARNALIHQLPHQMEKALHFTFIKHLLAEIALPFAHKNLKEQLIYSSLLWNFDLFVKDVEILIEPSSDAYAQTQNTAIQTIQTLLLNDSKLNTIFAQDHENGCLSFLIEQALKRLIYQLQNSKRNKPDENIHKLFTQLQTTSEINPAYLHRSYGEFVFHFFFNLGNIPLIFPSWTKNFYNFDACIVEEKIIHFVSNAVNPLRNSQAIQGLIKNFLEESLNNPQSLPSLAQKIRLLSSTESDPEEIFNTQIEKLSHLIHVFAYHYLKNQSKNWKWGFWINFSEKWTPTKETIDRGLKLALHQFFQNQKDEPSEFFVKDLVFKIFYVFATSIKQSAQIIEN